MNIAHAQKSSTVQKVADSKAISVLDSSSQSESLQRKADMTNNVAQRAEAKRPNNTGMPDNLKSGIESLSGFSMDNVRVHYNSSKPATVQALAYTQGTDIHVAPGQEKCLPHEAWHVAQQMAGRVSPTTNINGMPVNDNASLEHEADVMGEKAVQCKKEKNDNLLMCKNGLRGLAPIQMEREKEFKQDPEKFMRENIVLCDFALGLKKGYNLNDSEVKTFTYIMDLGIIKEYYFTLTKINRNTYVLTLALEKCDLSLCDDYVNYCESVRHQIEYLKNKKQEDLTPEEMNDVAIRISKLENEMLSYDAHRKNLLVFFDSKKFSQERKKMGKKEYIEANYVPYKIGTPVNAERDVGHIDVKRERNGVGNTAWNPDFVFTGGMLGCAFATTKKDDDEDSFTLWHYQSPKSSSNLPYSSEFRQSKAVTDWFGDEEYFKGVQEPFVDGIFNYPVATNFLWRSKVEGWKVISQENHVLFNTANEMVGVKTLSPVARTLNLFGSLSDILKELEKCEANLFDGFLRIYEGKGKNGIEHSLFLKSKRYLLSIRNLIGNLSRNLASPDGLVNLLTKMLKDVSLTCGDDEYYKEKYLTPLAILNKKILHYLAFADVK